MNKQFERFRRNNFLSPCNGFHDEFHILIRFYDEYVTVFRRDQFRGVVQYFR